MFSVLRGRLLRCCGASGLGSEAVPLRSTWQLPPPCPMLRCIQNLGLPGSFKGGERQGHELPVRLHKLMGHRCWRTVHPLPDAAVRQISWAQSTAIRDSTKPVADGIICGALSMFYTVGTVPPSITCSEPATDAARGDTRKVIRSATSFGVAGRPTGMPPSQSMTIFFPPS